MLVGVDVVLVGVESMICDVVIVSEIVRYGGISEVWVCQVVVRGEIGDDAGMKGLMVRIVCGGVFDLLGRTLCVDGIRVSVDRLVNLRKDMQSLDQGVQTTLLEVRNKCNINLNTNLLKRKYKF